MARVALVTGASGAIGSAIAQKLAADGMVVAVHWSTNQAGADDCIAAIEKSGGTAISVQADLRQTEQVEALFQTVLNRFGQLDVIVANAGAGAPAAAFQDITDEDLDAALDTNVKATFKVLRQAAKTVADHGRIIAISSSLVDFPSTGMATYAGSKAIVRTWAKVLAEELGSRQITVNAVSPGPTIPGMFSFAGPDLREVAAAASPLGRLGAPQDTAEVVSFLASDSGAWITGQHMLVNGGATM
ncbi:SDR family oxidoreductase [Aestuariibius sp. 2305UL40-4]|uniref:SDR family oxidoreductase n=1 Tax=Aestuariibius violaceus TaxID=3234132 RepID=UPI00345EEEF5